MHAQLFLGLAPLDAAGHKQALHPLAHYENNLEPQLKRQLMMSCKNSKKIND